MKQHQTTQPKWIWPVIFFLLLILSAITIYLLLKPKRQQLIRVLAKGKCYDSIPDEKSKEYLKLYVRYKTDDFKSLDLASFQFNNMEYANSCMKKTSDDDGYLLNAFVSIKDAGTEVPFHSVISSPVKPFKYSLEVIAVSTAGDTLLKYKKDTTAVLSHTYHHLNGTIKLKP